MKILTSGMMLVGLVACLVALGGKTDDTVRILRPPAGDSLFHDQGQLFLLSVAKVRGDSLAVATQWKIDRVYEIGPTELRENFAKAFYKLFDPGMTLQTLTFSFKHFKGYTTPESLVFSHSEKMTIRKFWQHPGLSKLFKDVQTTDGSELVLSLRGWRDSTYVPVYDDPDNADRWLYKLNLQLIPGVNDLHFAVPGAPETEVEYTASLVNEPKPLDSFKSPFHNSKLEATCATCHEGLPSSSEGKSMKAECAVCHKSKISSSYVHAPAEMKECTTCHGWSSEEKRVTVEQGVPAACYTCHEEKAAQVDSSQFPHPVAGECTTCHSPHGSESKHLLKDQVYTLCVGCHEDQKKNHPVGRHPVRYNLLKNGEEITCASCHNPHGSKYESLFRTPAGRMEMCSECH